MSRVRLTRQYFLNQSFTAVFVISVIALIVSFAAEALTKVTACKICNIQRACYFTIMPISLSGIFTAKKNVIGLILLLLSFGSFSIASYHVGIQLGFFSDTCIINSPADLNEFKKMMFHSTPSCSTISWLFGLPISVWSLLVSLTCFSIIAIALKRNNFGHRLN
jgi:disulfide bond formation protein DsbB